MRHIAFATSADYPELTPDDHLAVEALATAGVSVRAAIWDDPGVRWDAFDAVVVRSCWNYHLRPGEFLEWLAAVEATGVPLFNAPGTVRWNLDKSYLADLARDGIAVPPTVWLERGSEVDLGGLLVERGWKRAVVKPAISASAYETWTTSPARAAADAPRLRALLDRSTVMLQPFLDEVCTGGEWSLIFFDGAYSHSVLKRPAAGDFRVQSELGGSHEAAEPPARLVEAAKRTLEAAPGRSLYARVDGVDSNGDLLLMELELIDPVLFFALDPAAPSRFARALADV
jgi:glutathione synthase/RimK-type ligase-like ATP-grasp enzyme